jgi:AhpC/TSA family
MSPAPLDDSRVIHRAWAAVTALTSAALASAALAVVLSPRAALAQAMRPELPTLTAAAVARARRTPILPFLALTPPGEMAPSFDFPLRSADLRGRPALITLWSTECPWGRDAIRTVARLDRAFRARGVAVVVLGGNMAAELRAYEDSARTGLRFAIAGEALPAIFDRSTTAPPDPRGRVEFVLPSHLIVDGVGRVVYRDFGNDIGRAAVVLDSLARMTP